MAKENRSTTDSKSSPPSGESGIYIVLSAIMLVAIVSLLALVIGIGTLTINRAKTQAVANVVAFAALSGFVENANSAYIDRVAAGLQNANFVLQSNKPTTGKNYSSLTIPTSGNTTIPSNSSGSLVFGRWWVEAIDDQNPCNGNYPCFVPNPYPPLGGGPEPVANAARVTVRNQNDNPILAPFASFLGYDSFTIQGEATSTIIPRCTAFLIDVSPSTVFETHKPLQDLEEVSFDSENHPTIDSDTTGPQYPTFFAYKVDNIPPSGGRSCLGTEIDNTENLHWCITENDSPERQSAAVGTAEFSDRHFLSDYLLPLASGGSVSIADATEVTKDSRQQPVNVVFDRFYNGTTHIGPQPFVTFLKAFNSTTRRMLQEQVSGDRVLLAGFAGSVLQTVGPSQDLGLMAQLTNYMNVGLYRLNGSDYEPHPDAPEIHPNILDMGIFPLTDEGDPRRGNTSLVDAIFRTADAMDTCPTGSSKSIILASDGIATCMWGDNPADAVTYTAGDPTDCQPDRYDYFTASRTQLFETVVPALNDRGIRITTLARGAQIDPHYLNIEKPVAEGGGYYNYYELVAQEYDGTGVKKMISNPPVPADLSDPSELNPFTPALALLVDLAVYTDGIYCPLLTPGASSDYDHEGKLRDELRIPNGEERRPLYNHTIEEQAADCALRTIGSANPFTLVEE